MKHFSKLALFFFIILNPVNAIVGGTDIFLEHSPWQVSLTKPGVRNFCGGVLINRATVLTSAKCLFIQHGDVALTASEIIVSGGGSGKKSKLKKLPKVESIIIHDSYSGINGNYFNNDIALLILSEEIKVTNSLRPIKLLNVNIDFNDKKLNFYSTGWGYHDLTPGNYNRPKSLKVIELQYIASFQDDSF